MRNFLLIIIVLLTSLQLNAQTINGSISDSQTGESLIGVTVYVTNQQKGSITDVDGIFVLSNLLFCFLQTHPPLMQTPSYA